MILSRVIEHVKAQHWTAIAIDFLIVVAGILLAFQITEWSEARRERALERDYLERIASELDQSITALEVGITLAGERAELGQFLIASIDNPDMVRTQPGRFVYAVLTGAYTYSPPVRAYTFEEMKSSGDLGIFRDKALLLDLMEFYTQVQSQAQWNYLREAVQTEYLKRSAGILTHDLLEQTPWDAGFPDIAVDDAMAAYARMIERPSFIEWLPTVANRYEEIQTYRAWLISAKELRARILGALGRPAPTLVEKETPP
ncbi:MAG: hypothetical protein WB812_06830 [Woeseiaceae bacterium]